ncbi:hypothetical protein EI77_03238 [Prosthecobacter fusiformis]|uniref:Uncharacterized protein n=1 Tax=Prosthecobacter fusiformis TaxID=48464 RepID=A0A4R7RRD7_9BACT|nr:hypothetical protein [Prosthecobacter fusiformis]TDU68121.1 hypothetical protein EI77_03238 [Prosthecobacter fusiformis]
MAVLTRHARLLCLLALFQLLGGPLVLGGIMMVARMMTDREMTLAQSVTHTLQKLGQDQMHAADDQECRDINGLLPPAQPKAPQPYKFKDTKEKLWVVNDLGGFAWKCAHQAKNPHPDWHDPVMRRLAHAPPIPPPRWS